jgi:hypothetical protein
MKAFLVSPYLFLVVKMGHDGASALFSAASSVVESKMAGSKLFQENIGKEDRSLYQWTKKFVLKFSKIKSLATHGSGSTGLSILSTAPGKEPCLAIQMSFQFSKAWSSTQHNLA